MNKRKCRCFKAISNCDASSIVLYFTVADFGDADQLFTCVHCGALFAIDPEREYYSGVPFSTIKGRLSCPECGNGLVDVVPYPDTFICPDGSEGHFSRSDNSIPPDSEAVLVEFWDPYSEFAHDSH